MPFSFLHMKYKQILITGGAGFIGSHLTDHLINEGYVVRIMDNIHPQIHPSGKPPTYLNSKAEFMQGDVTSKKDWQKAVDEFVASVPDTVLERAMKSFPPEVRSMVGDKTLSTLKLRRDALPKAAIEYYDFLAMDVDIPLSDKKNM